jgi:hypothetical protein
MAWATKYYYNRNKYQVSLTCVGDKVYYIPPKGPAYVQEELAEGFELPPGVSAVDNPDWWDESMWPYTMPWMPQP